MVTPEIKNIERVRSQVDGWLNRITKHTEEVARGLSVTLLERMIQNSPQWSGDFASNWKYSVGRVDSSYEVGDVPPKTGGLGGPWQQFDRPAVQLGLFKNKGKDLAFKLGDTVYISNFSAHDEEYAGGIFSGAIKLRDVNSVVKLKSVLNEFNHTYGTVLTARQANYLRGKRL